MKARLNMSFAIAGTALILLTGCVSSRKFKASQAELAKVRSDSAQLAQQVTSLNGNVQDLQGRNTALQHSLDSTSTNYAAEQKSLEYYQGYFKEQQDTLATVSQDIRATLTQAGIANGDVEQTNTAIYVRLDENDLFKKSGTMVTPVGKQVLDGVARVIMSRPDANVAVGSGDSAVGWVATDNLTAAAINTAPRHHKAVHTDHSNASTANTNTQNGGNDVAPAHKKVHHKYSSEGSMAIYNRPGYPHNHAWALKQGRMVTVANHFLKNGLPKVNLTLQEPPMNGTPGTTIKITIRPAVKDLNPQQNSSAASGTR